MTMSHKDFDAMAIEFGLAIRWCANAGSQDLTDAQLLTVKRNVESFCRVAKSSNSLFDRQRFLDFVDDVATQRRDAFGKLVPVKKEKTKKD